MAIIIFLAGVCCGLFIGGIHPRLPWRQGNPEEKVLKNLSSKFGNRLDLTEEQKEKLSQILARHRQSMEKLREEIKPRFESLKNSIREEINLILDDRQKEKFGAMAKKFEKHGARHGRRRGDKDIPLKQER